MNIIKSLSVGNGDMFYIKHKSDNFTLIDCCMSDDNREGIVEEIKSESKGKGITRFISTHPDDDHMLGIEYLDKKQKIINFYCVENETTKEDETDDFKKYCELRDAEKVFYLHKGCSRKWMNISDEEREHAELDVLWPVTDNEHYIDALEKAKNGESPNNISPIVQFSEENGVTMLWMGDLETDFMENIEDSVDVPEVDILFAPHHGRDSGKVPESWLEKMYPQIVIIGEAPSRHLNYYNGYNTITQNSADHITFECVNRKVHIFTSNEDYSVNFLDDEGRNTFEGYIGTLNL